MRYGYWHTEYFYSTVDEGYFEIIPEHTNEVRSNGRWEYPAEGAEPVWVEDIEYVLVPEEMVWVEIIVSYYSGETTYWVDVEEPEGPDITDHSVELVAVIRPPAAMADDKVRARISWGVDYENGNEVTYVSYEKEMRPTFLTIPPSLDLEVPLFPFLGNYSPTITISVPTGGPHIIEFPSEGNIEIVGTPDSSGADIRFYGNAATSAIPIQSYWLQHIWIPSVVSSFDGLGVFPDSLAEIIFNFLLSLFDLNLDSLTSPWDINWDVSTDASYDTSAKKLTGSISGWHNKFPSFEIYTDDILRYDHMQATDNALLGVFWGLVANKSIETTSF